MHSIHKDCTYMISVNITVCKKKLLWSFKVFLKTCVKTTFLEKSKDEPTLVRTTVLTLIKGALYQLSYRLLKCRIENLQFFFHLRNVIETKWKYVWKKRLGTSFFVYTFSEYSHFYWMEAFIRVHQTDFSQQDCFCTSYIKSKSIREKH